MWDFGGEPKNIQNFHMDFGSGPGPTGPQKLVCMSTPKYERLYQKIGRTQSSHLTQCPSELLG